jgi:Flp pilus assembly protein TadD
MTVDSPTSVSAGVEIERASEALRQGRFPECAAICGAIVARDPEHAVATHLLGLAIKETGDWAQGEQWLRLSVELAPEQGEFHANLANLLRRRQRYRQAERFYRRALELLPAHRAARRGLALTLTDLGRFDEAEAVCRGLLADEPADAESLVILGLALTRLERLQEAEATLRRALALDPSNAIAHHNLGALLAQLNKPEAALAALQNASGLGQEGYEVAFNKGRALVEVNEIEAAEGEFERAVALRPTSVDAQLQLARVRYMCGDPKFARALAGAARAHPRDAGLHLLLAEVLWRSGRLPEAEVVLQDLLARQIGGGAHVRSILACVLLEAGRLKEAEALAVGAATEAPQDGVISENLVSVLLARGRPDDAMPFIQAQRRRRPDSQAWLAYEATAARSLSPDRYRELYDYDRLVRVFELEPPPGWSSMRELNAALAETLAPQHRLRNHPLDQTLRNGTQGPRSLLADDRPVIKAILSAFEGPIAEYRGQLGHDAAHPMSARNSGATGYTGAWSVCLRRHGHHINHFHPDGWLSSAYYVDTPLEAADPVARCGWIKFGEPRYAVPGANPERFIEPRPGRLVLFPSYMWHGTTPMYADAPRLTIAFDVKPV